MATRTLVRRPQQARKPQTQLHGGDLESLYSILGLVAPTTSLPVTERTVNGLVGVSAAVGKIANAAAMMMVDAQVFGPDQRTPKPTPAVVVDPCTGYDSFVFWREQFSSALMRGNAIGIKCDYDVDGWPQQVLPVPFDAVHSGYTEQGFVFYEIGGERFDADEICHVRVGLTIPGEIMAIGVIEAHRRNLSGMLDMQGMANGVWRGGAVPSGVVQLDIDMPTAEQAGTVKENWIGLQAAGRTVAVIGKRMSYTPVAWSAADAQWLESRTFSIAEAALMFGLRPEDLGSSFGASSSMTYGNRTDDAIQRITDSYLPVMMPAEQQWSRLIPDGDTVKGNVEALLRSTTRERYELHKLAQSIGVETTDETREAEGKPPAPKPDPPPPPPPPPDVDPDVDHDPPAPPAPEPEEGTP